MGYRRQICRVQLSVIVVALAAIIAADATRAATAAEDAVDKARLEKMLADGDAGMIVQVFKRHPGHTLPFIDSYLEGGLAMIEKGEDQAQVKALASFRTGIRFAKLADEAFGGTTFSDYANSFASWSPSEQKAFREGQREFKAGVKAEDLEESLQHLRKSLALARPLGDAWGQAMAQQAIAEKLLALGDHEAALAAAHAAVELNISLRLQSDAVASLLIAANAAPAHDGRPTNVGYLSNAWAIAEHDTSIDPAQRATVLAHYLATMDAIGLKDRADEIRRAEAARGGATE